MNVLDITKLWLEEHGCDGLCDPDYECACNVDDLRPCGESPLNCQPGRIVGRTMLPVPDSELFPTRQERVERRLREALDAIGHLSAQGTSDMCLAITHLAEFALDWVPENEDMDRAVEDLPGKESDDERVY